MKVHTSIVVAMAENNVIGINNALPWHIPEDLKRFKSVTMGKPCIMGRKTFESILTQLGKPLPGRENIIVSAKGYKYDGIASSPDIDSALERGRHHAMTSGTHEVMIIGGAEVYKQALPRSDRIYLTRVHKTVEGDAHFPKLSDTDWKETAREDHAAYSFITLERK